MMMMVEMTLGAVLGLLIALYICFLITSQRSSSTTTFAFLSEPRLSEPSRTACLHPTTIPTICQLLSNDGWAMSRAWSDVSKNLEMSYAWIHCIVESLVASRLL